jgi:uncharacterized protein
MTERFSFEVDGEPLSATVYRPAKPSGCTFLMGHGTRAGQKDKLVVEFAIELAERGVLVVTYDFPFTAHGRRTPDRHEVLEATCRAAVVAARQCRPKNRLFIGGKSLGGRIACEVAAAGGEEVDDLAGIVLLGYPLHAIGKPQAPQWGHLRDVTVPVLIVQGTRDVFGTPEELRPALDVLPETSEIYAVDGGDHSLAVPRHGGHTQEQAHAVIQDEIAQWMAEISGVPASPAPNVAHAKAGRVAHAKARPIASRVATQLRALRRHAGS